MKKQAVVFAAGLGVAIMGSHPGMAQANLLQELRDGFQYRVETLAHHTFIELESKGINVENFLEFSRHESTVNLRPDFNLEIRRLGLDFRPRYDLSYRRFESGLLANTTNTVDDLYIQEWETRLSLTEALLLSTGRVNLQWGPSYVLSPSNPFNRSNGRNDPQVEEPGLDISQLIWFPNYRWTLTLIANTGKGRFTSEQSFSPRYAMRADFIGDGWFAGVLGSITEETQDPIIGGFAGWTVSEAVLLHTEWNVDSGTKNGNWVKHGDYLVGGSYTFTNGSFAVAEFFRDGTGCVEPNVGDCFNFFLGNSADQTDLLFRKNYVLLQFTYPFWQEQVDWTVRWIHGLDDGSSRGIGIFEWNATDHSQLFLTGVADFGSPRDEFGSVVRGAARLGLKLVF